MGCLHKIEGVIDKEICSCVRSVSIRGGRCLDVCEGLYTRGKRRTTELLEYMDLIINYLKKITVGGGGGG